MRATRVLPALEVFNVQFGHPLRAVRASTMMTVGCFNVPMELANSLSVWGSSSGHIWRRIAPFALVRRRNTPGYEQPPANDANAQAAWWVVYTPNSRRLHRPNVYHETSVRMRADGGLAYSDPTRLPQWIVNHYQHFTFIRVPPAQRRNGLGTSEWWADDVERMLYTSAVVLLNHATSMPGSLGRRMYRVGSEDLTSFRVALLTIDQRSCEQRVSWAILRVCVNFAE